MLGVTGGGERHRGGADRHDERPRDYQRQGNATAAELAEDERAPEEPPELVGVGEGNAAADADVLGGVLLEEVADDPDEPAEHEPEEHAAGGGELVGGGGCTVDGERDDAHAGELTHGEEGDEGERRHAGEVRLAIGDVHRAPERAGTQCRDDAARRRAVRGLVGGGECQERGADTHGHGAAEHAGPLAAGGAAQLAEEEGAPEDAEEAVRIPEREGDAQADIADGVDGERIGDGPEAAGEDGPDDEVRGLAYVGAHGGGPLQQGGEAPAGEEDAAHHDERDHDRAQAGGDELGGSLGGTEPSAGSDAAQEAGGAQRAAT